PSEENLARFCSVNKNKVLQALLWLCAYNPVYRSVTIDHELLDSWPPDHIPQEIRDAFLAVESSTASTVQDEREGYATSLEQGLFENELDAEVGDAEPGTIISRSFFSDFHGQDPQSTTALLASLQAVLESKDSEGLRGMFNFLTSYNWLSNMYCCGRRNVDSSTARRSGRAWCRAPSGSDHSAHLLPECPGNTTPRLLH
ncbi:hypothetical protein BKA61DRAFT_493934, partial [Leptodontidium sp. MPI-SDFR-AT-0119]